MKKTTLTNKKNTLQVALLTAALALLLPCQAQVTHLAHSCGTEPFLYSDQYSIASYDDNTNYVCFNADEDGLPTTGDQCWTSPRLSGPSPSAGSKIRITFTESMQMMDTRGNSFASYLADINYAWPKIALAELEIYDANGVKLPIDTNNYIDTFGFTFYNSDISGSRGNPSMLFDGTTTGNTSNLWHSITELYNEWDADNPDKRLNQYPYIEFTVPSGYDLSTFQIKYWTRSTAANPSAVHGNPLAFRISYSPANATPTPVWAIVDDSLVVNYTGTLYYASNYTSTPPRQKTLKMNTIQDR